MANAPRPGFFFLICPDSELARAAMELQLKKHGADDKGRWKKLVFWGDEEPGDRFWESLGQIGLFAENRIVVARNAQEWPAGVWKEISTALSRPLEHAWPFFWLEVGCEKGKFKIPAHILKARCMAFAEKNGWVWRNPGLNGASLASFVQNEAKKLGLIFDQEARELFCDSARPDALAIVNELKKLALASEDGKITVEMINRNAGNLETDAFRCVQRLEACDLKGAWKEMSRGNASSLLFFLIALFAREFRVFWRFKAGESPRMRPADASAKRELAERIGYAGIAAGFAALADAEWQVKSGSRTPEQAMEFLVVELAAVFSGKRKP